MATPRRALVVLPAADPNDVLREQMEFLIAQVGSGNASDGDWIRFHGVMEHLLKPFDP
jgi:hypothetical protein